MRIKAGTRGSLLARKQTQSTLDALGIAYEICIMQTPGDRDLTTDLRISPADFFTRDLDDALRSGVIDCAVHSAKDLPEVIPEDIDWFWVSWSEDPADAWILPKGRTWESLPAQPRLGISSERRADYARKALPDAQLLPIRGAIDARLEQLDRGDFDCLIMAIAALKRLNLEDRITRPISLIDLPPPDGQGRLAITFRKGDPVMGKLRLRYMKAVRFVSAGVGDGELCTLAGVRELAQAEVCIYDTLLGHDLIDHLPPTCHKIFVGKRSGTHAMKQPEISAIICDYARRGFRVVRLKGGDAGLFGRLAEEVEALDALGLPYCVWPGVSALTAATTATGILLTRRAESKGFTVETLRSQGDQTPTVFFMSLSVATEIVARYPAETPVAIVFNAGSYDRTIKRMTVGDLATFKSDTTAPGIIIVGEISRYGFPEHGGALQGKRIWSTASATIAEKARTAILDRSGIPFIQPLISLHVAPEAEAILAQMKTFDDLIVTSPASARILLASRAYDRRDLPRISVCGPGTSAIFEAVGIKPDIMPESDYSTRGLKACLPDLTTRKVLRLRSDKAKWTIGTDCILYHNDPVTIEKLPQVDAIFFASASAVESLYQQHGDAAFNCDLIAMGEPTAIALRAISKEPTVIAITAILDTAIATYAEHLERL